MAKLVFLFAVFFLLFDSSYGSIDGALRLVRNGQPTLSQAWNSGIVQIYYNDEYEWGNICDDSNFGSNEADVICHQLSYTGASSYTNTANSNSYGTDSSDTAIEDVSCSSSNLLVLLQCNVSSQYSSLCSGDTYDVIVDCYSTRIWDSAYTGQIRLSSGQYSNEGLLEIYCNGQWGTVCDDFFGSTDATVACRQLGYNTYASYGSFPVTGNSSQPIWLDDVLCSSSDTCLKHCETCPASEYHNCGHDEDVNLECTYYSIFSKPSTVTEETCRREIDTTGPSSVGSMRLLNSGSTSLYNTAGRVQVWYGGQWGNICDDVSFNANEADVICHQLGWSGASSYSSGTSDGYGTDNLPTVIDDLSCSLSSYLTIFQCSYSSSIDSGCSDDNDVAVTCYSTRIWDSAYTGQIRLSRGQYSNEGLLEIYCNGQWGTVCDDSFLGTEATVACRQLGYNTYTSYTSHTISGNSSQRIWLDDVDCSSLSYSCLAYCATCPSAEYDNCGHSEDVNLECSWQNSGTLLTTTSTCQYANSGPTDDTDTITDPTDDTTFTDSSSLGGTIGGIIGGSVFFTVALPICIICCIIFGARSATRTRRAIPTTRVVATATTATIVTDTQQQQQYQPQPQYATPIVYSADGGYPNTDKNPLPLSNPYCSESNPPPASYPYPPPETTPTGPPPGTGAPLGYPPVGTGVPPGYPSPGYPLAGTSAPGYPPAGTGPPGYPPAGISAPGYPPASTGAPGYPPAGTGAPGYPPAVPGYPPAGTGVPPGYPPAGAGVPYPPSVVDTAPQQATVTLQSPPPPYPVQ